LHSRTKGYFALPVGRALGATLFLILLDLGGVLNQGKLDYLFKEGLEDSRLIIPQDRLG